jgi:diguanylate cyclase
MSDEKNRRILIVDGNQSIHDDFAEILGPIGLTTGRPRIGAVRRAIYEIDSALHGEEGVAMVQRSVVSGRRYAIAFIDIHTAFGGTDGPAGRPDGAGVVETIEELWAVDPELQIVICTGNNDSWWEGVLDQLDEADRLLFLRKPLDAVEVGQLARALTEKWRLSRRAHLKLIRLESQLEEQSQELRAAKRRLEEEISKRGRSDQARLVDEERRALHDPLTGLANRALLMDRVERALLRAKRDPDHHFALLYLGLDRFKLINDSLGRALGDQLLVAVARRLTASVRVSVTSTLASHHLLSRLGGDEFVLLLDGLRAGAEAGDVAERLQQSLVEPFELDGHEVWSSTSVGIAHSKLGYERPEDILRDADIALYQSKASGNGRLAVFDQGMHASAVARWRMENELRRALDRSELRLLYQPIMSLETGEVRELEALVRWQHPERGLITPDAFVPLAEETGLIVPLGYWVLREACADLRRWQAKAPSIQDMAIGVNVSAKQFAQSDIVEEISQILKSTGVEPRQLKLEITESAIMEDGGTTLAGLARLRELDLQFRLDDFGTGYSSLSYLHRMPIDALKIDRSFVNAMTSDPMSGSIVRAVVALAHTLGMHVVAEGIETKDQLDQLRAMQCDCGQGFYLSVPLHPDQVLELLSSKQPGG